MAPWIFEHGTLWALDLGSSPLVRVAPLIPVRFCEVARADGAMLAAAMGLSDTALVFQRLGAGRRAFAAWVEREIAAYGWYSEGMECIGELEQALIIPERDGYIWDCSTREMYRGRHLYSALLSHIAAVLRDEGLFRLWIGAMSRNIASIRGFAAAGFQPVVTMTYTRVWNFRRRRVHGVASASPELVATARQALRMPASLTSARSLPLMHEG